ncbi:MAG: hypothetical protein J5I93_10845 [Pirellulaceae bacterium]|nr:hypothetical protein [Pirellulaceae bacterium]
MPEATPKVHPASREILPDDPLEMTGFELPGDPDLMLRLLVEEFGRIGWNSTAIMRLARDPNYQAFHGLWRQFGEVELRRRIDLVLARCGVMRVRQTEAPAAGQLVELKLSLEGK